MTLKNALTKLSPFVLTVAITVLLAFYGIPQEPAALSLTKLIQHYGYWYMFFLVVATALCLIKIARLNWTNLRPILRKHRIGILAILVGTAFMHMHQPHQLKIIYDETSLLGTSRSMHETREVYTARRAHVVFEQLIDLEKTIDKRPLLYPFLLSIVHDLTGYQIANTFVLNGVLTLALLTLLYAIFCRLGEPMLGLLAITLACGLPLLAHMATSGSLALLNLVMILTLAHACLYYLRRPGAEGLWLMILCGLLLACTRYESALYLLAIPIVCLAKWKSEGEITLTRWHYLAPLLAIGPLLYFTLHISQPDNLQLEDKSAEVLFSTDYLQANLTAAQDFLFSTGSKRVNSLLLSTAGLLALAYLTFKSLPLCLKQIKQNNREWSLLAIPLITLINTALILHYFWGDMTDPSITRLYLPLHLLLIIAPPFALKLHPKLQTLTPHLIGIALLYLIFFTIPANIKANPTKRLIASNMIEWLYQNLETYPQKDTLLILPEANPGIIKGYPSTSIANANQHINQLKHTLETSYYDTILLVEEWTTADGKPAPLNDALNPEFNLKLIEKLQLQPARYFMLFEVTAPIQSSKPLPPPPTDLTHPQHKILWQLP